MKNKPFDEDIFRVAAETVEVLALMFLIPEEDSHEESGPTIAANVDFMGPSAGSLAVSISQDLLPELAANMLGEEQASKCSTEQQHDALKELTNVICGNLLPILGGERAIFNVGTPQLVTADPNTVDNQNQICAGQATLFLDQGILRVDLYVDEKSVSAEQIYS